MHVQTAPGLLPCEALFLYALLPLQETGVGNNASARVMDKMLRRDLDDQK